MAEVWIADDDNAIRFVLGEALREAGVERARVRSAEDLLAALRQGRRRTSSSPTCACRVPAD